MPAYLICTMTIHDPATYRKYTALTPATVACYGGRFLTRGDQVELVEGGPDFTERMVLLEFPDREAAMAWHGDAEYQAAAVFRRAASSVRILLQESSGNTKDPNPKV